MLKEKLLTSLRKYIGYRCSRCGVKGLKLWRPNLKSVAPTLVCFHCMKRNEEAHYVPAIPDGQFGTPYYLPFNMVTEQGRSFARWLALPTYGSAADRSPKLRLRSMAVRLLRELRKKIFRPKTPSASA